MHPAPESRDFLHDHTPYQSRYDRTPPPMPEPAEQTVFCSKLDSYCGIWWGQSPTGDEFAYKYSGGLGTYPVQNAPLAVYAPEVNKTFFVWGGTVPGSHRRAVGRDSEWNCGPGFLLHMVSYYDHADGSLARPTVLLDKWTADPHDNPVLTLDGGGHLWIFSPSHGHLTGPSYIHRSTKPWSIDRFETIQKDLYAYPQVWWSCGKGFAFFHSQYARRGEIGAKRGIHFKSSADGKDWTDAGCLGCLELGHYQVTAERDGVIASAFDYHPKEGGLEARTNIYFVCSRDFGRTWETVDGRQLELPVARVDHPALIRNFASEGLLVYLKDLVFDERGHPVIHYVTSKGWRPGPEAGPHRWELARWDGSAWRFSEILVSDNNYDMGSMDLSDDAKWRIMGTSGKGPQTFNTGGEMELWCSADCGETWEKERDLTAGSLFNHSHPRRVVNAHPDFQAFWADGHARSPSDSQLYFASRDGRRVERMI